VAALAPFIALVVAAAGCGGGGVAEGATVTVYVSAPLHGAQAAAGRAMCAGARRELARGGGRAAGLRVRAVCLDDSGATRRWSLAAVGANARRATEDSTAIGYIGELDPAATRFSRPIVESAGIAQLSTLSGPAAMASILGAIREAGRSASLREAVREELSRR
jgi:hypothetical protein